MRLSAKYDVPGELALLYDFANSIDLRTYVEGGVAHERDDQLRTTAQLASWMRAHGITGSSSPSAHRHALRLRETLRDFLGVPPDERKLAKSAMAAFNAASASLPLVVAIDAGLVSLRSASDDQGLGQVLAEFHALAATGQLDRLKMCQSPECGWIFFDRSKPASRRWCSSDRCGNREKTRSYRMRQRRSEGRARR
jgi:predicted RNA-binding Zn ribbon-like protein